MIQPLRFAVTVFTGLFMGICPAFAQVSFNASGAGGGAVVVGASTTTCDSTIPGALRWSSTNTCVEVCNGTSWICVMQSACDSIPTFSTFTNQSDLNLSTQYASNIHQLSGMGVGCVASIGVNAPVGTNAEYRVCSTSNCSSVDIDWTTANNAAALQGKYVQVRGTTSGSTSTGRTITLTIGGGTMSFRITTIATDCSTSGPVGTVCGDGTVYAGTSADGNVPIYVTRCDYNMSWNGSSCANTRTGVNGNNGLTNWVDTALTNCATSPACDASGETNTTTLASADSDSVTSGTQLHGAAKYCDDLSLHSQTDWYLPSASELDVIRTNRTAIGNFSTGDYWSSSESDSQNFWSENFNTGTFTASAKNLAYYVRCARK